LRTMSPRLSAQSRGGADDHRGGALRRARSTARLAPLFRDDVDRPAIGVATGSAARDATAGAAGAPDELSWCPGSGRGPDVGPSRGYGDAAPRLPQPAVRPPRLHGDRRQRDQRQHQQEENRAIHRPHLTRVTALGTLDARTDPVQAGWAARSSTSAMTISPIAISPRRIRSRLVTKSCAGR
jgi:hypothetical protein